LQTAPFAAVIGTLGMFSRTRRELGGLSARLYNDVEMRRQFMKRSRAALLLACAFVIAVVAGAGIALIVPGHRSAGAAAPAAVPSFAPSAAASTEDGQRVADTLRKLPGDPQALVASEAQGQVAGRARQAIPSGTTVTPDEKSWAPDGVGGGAMLVTVTVPGHAPVTYDAIMVSQGGQWKVLATIPVAASPSAAAVSSASAS
jgi:hypothetical protein